MKLHHIKSPVYESEGMMMIIYYCLILGLLFILAYVFLGQIDHNNEKNV